MYQVERITIKLMPYPSLPSTSSIALATWLAFGDAKTFPATAADRTDTE